MISKLVKTGEIEFSKDPLEYHMVLGSCVAVCIFDKIKGFSGACHYAVPKIADVNLTLSENNDKLGLSGEYAIKELLKKFKNNGSNPNNLEIYVLGGCNMGNAGKNIGLLNLNEAKIIFDNFNLHAKRPKYNVCSGIKVKFSGLNGEVFFKHIQTLKEDIRKPDSFSISDISSADKLNEKVAIVSRNGDNSVVEDTKNRKSVLIVEDSKVVQMLLKNIFSQDSRFEIFGVAENPLEAEKLMQNKQPDVVTLDLMMPEMDGITYLKSKFKKRKIPAVVISGASEQDGELALEALDNGAVDFIQKPSMQTLRESSITILNKVYAAANAKLYRSNYIENQSFKKCAPANYDPKKIVLIGASTGGTVALTQIVSELPDSIPPIVVVQHIPQGFSSLLAKRLNSLVNFNIKEAKNGDLVENNTVYIAPGNKQMRLKKAKNNLLLEVNDSPEVNKHKPSVDYLFHSVDPKLCPHIVAFLLTGMGKDGAQGLLNLRNNGSVTYSQDEKTSVVYGMPKEANKIGASMYQIGLHEVANTIVKESTLKKRVG